MSLDDDARDVLPLDPATSIRDNVVVWAFGQLLHMTRASLNKLLRTHAGSPSSTRRLGRLMKSPSSSSWHAGITVNPTPSGISG